MDRLKIKSRLLNHGLLMVKETKKQASGVQEVNPLAPHVYDCDGPLIRHSHYKNVFKKTQFINIGQRLAPGRASRGTN